MWSAVFRCFWLNCIDLFAQVHTPIHLENVCLKSWGSPCSGDGKSLVSVQCCAGMGSIWTLWPTEVCIYMDHVHCVYQAVSSTSLSAVSLSVWAWWSSKAASLVGGGVLWLTQAVRRLATLLVNNGWHHIALTASSAAPLLLLAKADMQCRGKSQPHRCRVFSSAGTGSIHHVCTKGKAMLISIVVLFRLST